MIKAEDLAKEFEYYGGIIEKAYNKTIIQITRDTSKFIYPLQLQGKWCTDF